MPQLETRRFGLVEYDPGAVVEFPAGIPAFEHERRFLPIERPNTGPFLFLQSLADPGLLFLALPVLLLDSGYRLELTPEDLELLGLDDHRPRIGQDVLCLAIVTLHDDQRLTANLMAPVVINVKQRRGLQVLQPDYPHQHPLPSVGEDPACS